MSSSISRENFQVAFSLEISVLNFCLGPKALKRQIWNNPNIENSASAWKRKNLSISKRPVKHKKVLFLELVLW